MSWWTDTTSSVEHVADDVTNTMTLGLYSGPFGTNDSGASKYKINYTPVSDQEIISQLQANATLQQQTTAATYTSYKNSSNGTSPYLSDISATEGLNSDIQNINANLATNVADVSYNTDLQNAKLNQEANMFNSKMQYAYDQQSQQMWGQLLGAGGAVLGGYLGGPAGAMVGGEVGNEFSASSPRSGLSLR